MSYDNLSSVSQNVLKFYQQLTDEGRRPLSFLVGTISNVLVMEIGWTDVGSGGYILVLVFIFLFHAKIVIFYIHQNILILGIVFFSSRM